jgi:hypothetical protein
MGTAVAVFFVIIPAAKKMPVDAQQAWWQNFAVGTKVYFPVLAGLTILLGIGRGIAGDVLSNLGTPYGITWIVALVIGAALGGWGARVSAPSVVRLAESTTAELPANVARTASTIRVDLAAFAVILALMVAMRFGY